MESFSVIWCSFLLVNVQFLVWKVDANITWTLPSPQHGPLSNTDISVRTTFKVLDGSSSELHLEWDFTLSDESLIRVSWKIESNSIIGTKTASGAVTLFPAFQGQFSISPNDRATLIIHNATAADGKKISCTVTTDVRDWNDIISVVIKDPTKIQNVITSSKKSWIGQTVTLKCLSDGVPTPTLSWYKPSGSEINRVTARENKVQVLLRDDQDFGDYLCIAANGLISSYQKLVKINQIKKPGKASIKLSESVIQATVITLRWTAPADDGGSPITAYRLILQKGETEIENNNITEPGTMTHSFSGLERNTNYTVKLFTRNFVFEGDPTVRTIKTKFEVQTESTEVYLRVTMQENCSRRSEVATKFPEMVR